MEEIYLLGWISYDVEHILAAFSSREELIKYIKEKYPIYEYDNYFGEQWHNTRALDPDEDYFYIIQIKFIK